MSHGILKFGRKCWGKEKEVNEKHYGQASYLVNELTNLGSFEDQFKGPRVIFKEEAIYNRQSHQKLQEVPCLSFFRCLTIVSPNLSNTQQLNLNHIGVNEPLKKLNCNNCRLCVYLSVTKNEWKLVDSLLHKKKKGNGWEIIQDTDELVKLYILGQVVYEAEREFDDSHVFFDFPDKTDFVKILWKDGNAIGFYTIKVKDSIVFGTMESYEMTTLDTAYVRKAYRKKGFGLSILEDVVKSFPNEDIAISTPVSLSMYYVVNKFLMLNPSYKVKLWEVSGVGSEGNRKLIFLTLKELFNF